MVRGVEDKGARYSGRREARTSLDAGRHAHCGRRGARRCGAGQNSLKLWPCRRR